MALIESWSVKCEDCGKLYENAGESEGSARSIVKSRGWTYSLAHGDRCQQCSRGAVKETSAAPGDQWLIRKRGYYYRPDRAGYTASIDEAGRYTEAEAKAEAAIEPAIMQAIPLSQALRETEGASKGVSGHEKL